MPLLLQSPRHSIKLTNRTMNQLEIQQAQASGRTVEDAHFTIAPGETKIAPDWVKSDWGYYAHIKDGNLVELKYQDPFELEQGVAMIPAGSPPMQEAIEAGKIAAPAPKRLGPGKPAPETNQDDK